MAIIYPLAAPAITGLGPQDFTLSEVNQVGETESPMTFEQQYQVWPGQRWQIEGKLPPMPISQAEQWLAFLGALKGKFGTCWIGDYVRQKPQGSMSPSVSGVVSNTTGSNNLAGSNQIFLRGAAPNVLNWAVAGDYISPTPQILIILFQVVLVTPWRLYKVLTNANSDGSGNVTLDVWPNVRETIVDNRPILTSNTFGTFRLQDNSLVWKIDRNRMYSIEFKMKEAIP